ncbi:MAG: M20 family metallo-hydrolase [Anaerolineae bacterium]|nr:M20 family metallo-hydrolase [Anaerolineae bacterium]
MTETPSPYSHLRVNNDRLRVDFEELAQIGATPEGGINRLALSPEDLLARAWFADRIEAAGLFVRDDDAGNLSGVLRSRKTDAKTLMLGSHLDSVPNGGRFDGSTGVLAALECLRVIKENSIQLPVHLEAISFTDDEGCWRSLFGSRAITGLLTEDDIEDRRVDNAPFRAALSRAGIDPRSVFRAERSSSTLAGYIELHIEQGERLARAGKDIGIVAGIVGRTTYRFTFYGQAAHSGTTDMYRRRDALRGAALFIVRAHDAVREKYGDGVFNCGGVTVKPGAFNIIPSEADLLVECRHVNARLMSEMEMMIVQIARECAATHGLNFNSEQVAHVPAAHMNDRIMACIEQAASMLELTTLNLTSYAGHDSQILSRITPCGMVFIPSIDGISHNPREYTPWQNVIEGANTLLHAVLNYTLGEA